MLVLLIAASIVAAPTLKVPDNPKAGKITTITVVDAPPGSVIVWRISPEPTDSVDRGQELLAVLAAGDYFVSASVISRDGEGLSRVDLRTAFTVGGGGGGGGGPGPGPGPGPAPKVDPMGARVRLTHGRAGCTASVIAPRRDDGRYWVVSAAHCVEGSGKAATGVLPDGTRLALTLVATDQRADLALYLTEKDVGQLPALTVAKAAAAKGVRVWHAGYGVDKPGNREEGTAISGPNPDGQCEYLISVSSGDSGGPIVHGETGEWLGAVCCTTRRGAVGRVWAGGPEALRRLLSSAGAKLAGNREEGWTPLPIPIRPESGRGF